MSTYSEPSGKIRLHVVATHPIQYQAPLYRQLAKSDVVDLRVTFLTDFGVAPSLDTGYARQIAYDVPLTEGYDHTFVSTGCVDLPRRYWIPPIRVWLRAKKRELDVILPPGYSHLSTWAVCLAAASRGIPYLMRGETRIETDMARPAPRRLLKRQVLGPLLRHAAACLAIGSSNRAFYCSYGVKSERIISAPYSVDNGFFAAEGAKGRAQRTTMLSTLGLDPRLPTLCFAAKLQPHKRPLDVFAALDRVSTPVNLIVIGDGPLYRQAADAAARQPRARLLGFVNQSEIGQWFGACDLLVLPSDFEPWGLVVNEAMAAGAVPIVSSEVGCGPDLVQPGGGAIFPVGDPAALARVLDPFVSRPIALAAARRANEAVIERHAIRETARGYERAAVLATASGDFT